MKTVIERESPTQVRLTINVEPAEVGPLYDVTLKRLGQEVKIPGFRQGKVPIQVLETRLGKEGIKEEVLRGALPIFFARAVKSESLRPVAPPDIDVTHFEKGQALSFTATVEVRPEITLPTYRGLEIDRPSTEVADEEVDKHLGRLQERYATLEPVSRNIAEGDYALLDLICYQHATQVEEMSVRDFLYEVGSKSFAASELDDELLEKRTGDILKLNATLDEELGEPWGGQEVTFQVLVKDVQVRRLPALGDEFAQTASEFDTLEELRNDLRGRAGQIREMEARAQMRNQAIDKLLAATEVALPKSLLKAETDERLRRLTEQIESAGMRVEDYLERNSMTREDLIAEVRKSAEKAVRSEMVLDAVAREEGIEASSEEVLAAIAAIAMRAGKDPEEVHEEMLASGRVGDLTGDILRRKALDFLVENAQVTDVATSLTLEVAP